MNALQADDIIYKYFFDNWTDTTVKILMENDDNIPNDNSSWVRLSVDYFDNDQTSMGAKNNRRFTRNGFFTFMVYTAQNIGTYTGKSICQSIIDMFEGEAINGINFLSGGYRVIGIDKDEIWYKFVGKIEFYFDEIK